MSGEPTVDPRLRLPPEMPPDHAHRVPGPVLTCPSARQARRDLISAFADTQKRSPDDIRKSLLTCERAPSTESNHRPSPYHPHFFGFTGDEHQTKGGSSARLTLVLASSICDHPAIAPDAKHHRSGLNPQRAAEPAAADMPLKPTPWRRIRTIRLCASGKYAARSDKT